MSNKTTVKAIDGAELDIKSFQQSLKDFPMTYKAQLSNDGTPYIFGAVRMDSKCGCTVIGNGTLQFPLMVKHCHEHKTN